MKTNKRLNKIQLQIRGLNQTKLLNMLNKENVDFFDVQKIKHDNMYIWVQKSDMQKAFAIFDKLCYNYSIVTQDIVYGLKKWGIKHMGALIASVVFSVLLVISNSFVWRVQVYGLNTIPYNTVENILQSHKVKVGILSSQIDKSAIKRELLTIDNVVDATINMSGTTLTVTVFENFAQEQLPPLNTTAILSNYDAVVTRVIATEGTPTVKPGDKVAKGDELVLPLVYDTNGQVLKEVNPQGYVYGVVTFVDSRFFTLNSTTIVRTGKTKTFNQLSIFGQKIQRKQTDFALYETTKKEQFLIGKSFLPIKVITTKVYELKKIDTQLELQEQKAKYEDQMLSMLELKANSKILQKKMDLREVAGGYRLDMFLSAEIKLNN